MDLRKISPVCTPRRAIRPVLNSPWFGVLLPGFLRNSQGIAVSQFAIVPLWNVTRFFVVGREAEFAEIDRRIYAQYGVNCMNRVVSSHGGVNKFKTGREGMVDEQAVRTWLRVQRYLRR